MKYIKQNNTYDCGPVAVYNSLVALGHPLSPAHLRNIRKFLRTKKSGTDVARLIYAFVSLFPETLITRNVNKAKKHLQKNLPCVIVYKGHTATVVRRGRKTTVLNFSNKGHVNIADLSVMKKLDSEIMFILLYPYC